MSEHLKGKSSNEIPGDTVRVVGSRSTRNESTRLFTNSAFPAFFGAMPTIPAVLTSMARIRTSASSRKRIERYLIDEKNGQHDLSQDGKQLVAH